MDLSRIFGLPWPPNFFTPGCYCCGTPVPRGSHDCTTVGTAMYSLCGSITGSTWTTHTREYTPSGDSWAAKTAALLERRISAASTISNKAYLYCGDTTGSTRLRDTDEYDPDTWTSKTDCPTPARHSPAAATIGSAGYIFGGNNGSAVADTDEYAPDTWTSKTDLSPAREAMGAFGIGSAAYTCAGASGATRYQDTDEYVPDTWTAKTDCPAPARNNLASPPLSGLGYLMGGNAASPSRVQDNDEYDDGGDSWTSRTDLAIARNAFSGSEVSSAAYVCGGGSSGGTLADTDEYVVDTWTNKSDMI